MVPLLFGSSPSIYVGLAEKAENIRVLYHYSSELAFLNVGNSQLSAAEIFASLKEAADLG